MTSSPMPVEHASTKNNTPPTTDELKFGYFQAFDVSGGCLFEDHYQTIVFVPHYMAFSVEELRLQDYKLGYGPSPGSDSANLDKANFPIHGYVVPHKPFRQPFLDKVAKLSGTQKQSQEPDQPFQKSQLGKIQKTLRGKGPIQCLFASLVPVTLPRLPAEVASWDFYFIPDANLTIRLVEVAVKGTEAMAPETDSSRVEVAVKGTEEVAPEADSSQPSPPPTSPETHYNFNVSSECLISTSRVFRAMLGMSETGSGFKEGAEFAATVAAGNLHKSAPSDESPVVLTPYVLKVESDDPVALNLVLNTIHEKITPAEVPFNILYQVAVLCDKYDWIQPSSPLHLNATRWAQNLWQPKPTEQGGYSNRQELNGWLFISWVFRLPNIFESTSRRLMMRTKVITQVSEGQADEIQGILDLSPADGVASQKIIDSIAQRRSRALTAILNIVTRLRDGYMNPKGISKKNDEVLHIPRCKASLSTIHCTPHCTMIIYGSLCRILLDLGYEYNHEGPVSSDPAEQFHNKSIYEACNILADFTIYYLPGHEPQDEIYQALIERTSKVLDDLQGLDVMEFVVLEDEGAFK